MSKQKYNRLKRVTNILAYGDVCVMCLHRFRLDYKIIIAHFHHIRKNHLHGMGRGSYKRAKDVMDNSENYVLLCADCHFLIHNESNYGNEKLDETLNTPYVLVI